MFSRMRRLLSVLCVLVAPGVALAQTMPTTDVSPVAPPTLKAPVFDTTKPVYDTADRLKQSANNVVAEVDGRVITVGAVADAIKDLPATMQNLSYEDVFPIVVDQLIRTQALAIMAQHKGVDSDDVVRRRMKAASDHVLANETLRIEASKVITEQALLDRYNKDIAGKPGPEEAHLLVIMVPTEAAALGIMGELRQGADFAALAKRSSQDGTASVGGDLGFVERSALHPEIAALAFATQPGQLAPAPVESGGAWFVIKVEAVRRQPTPPFSAERDKLRQAIIQEAVPDIVRQALSGVTVRKYAITGKELGDDPIARASAGSD